MNQQTPVVQAYVPKRSLEWAAGFLDGEGCIRIAKRDPGTDANHIYSLEVTITQNCLTTLTHFQDVLGVKSSIYVFGGTGAVRSTVYALTYRCTRAREVLEILRPFLVRKLREAGSASSSHCAPALRVRGDGATRMKKSLCVRTTTCSCERSSRGARRRWCNDFAVHSRASKPGSTRPRFMCAVIGA